MNKLFSAKQSLPTELIDAMQLSTSVPEQQINEALKQIEHFQENQHRLEQLMQTKGFADETSFFNFAEKYNMQFQEKLSEILSIDCAQNQDAVLTKISEFVARDNEGIYIDFEQFDLHQDREALIQELCKLFSASESTLVEQATQFIANQGEANQTLDPRICQILNCDSTNVIEKLTELTALERFADALERQQNEILSQYRAYWKQINVINTMKTNCIQECLELEQQHAQLQKHCADLQKITVNAQNKAFKLEQKIAQCKQMLAAQPDVDLEDAIALFKEREQCNLERACQFMKMPTASWDDLTQSIISLQQCVTELRGSQAQVGDASKDLVTEQLAQELGIAGASAEQVISQVRALITTNNVIQSSIRDIMNEIHEVRQDVKQLHNALSEQDNTIKTTINKAINAANAIKTAVIDGAEELRQNQQRCQHLDSEIAAMRESLQQLTIDNCTLTTELHASQQLFEDSARKIAMLEDVNVTNTTDGVEHEQYCNATNTQQTVLITNENALFDASILQRLALCAQQLDSSIQRQNEALFAKIQTKKCVILKIVNRQFKNVQGLIRQASLQKDQMADYKRQLIHMSSQLKKANNDSKMVTTLQARTGNAAREVKQLQNQLFYCRQQLQQLQNQQQTPELPQLMKNCASKALTSMMETKQQLAEIYAALGVASQDEALMVISNKTRCVQREYSDVSAIPSGETLVGLDKQRQDKLKMIKHDR